MSFTERKETMCQKQRRTVKKIYSSTKSKLQVYVIHIIFLVTTNTDAIILLFKRG